MAKCSPCYLDSSEKYCKQSWRNRCRILTANGPMDLRFPIVHNSEYGIKDVLVDYSTPWVRQTEYAIESAYSSSPFYDYYCEGLFAILDSQPRTLWELDGRLTGFLCSRIGIKAPEEAPPGCLEQQYDIHPKHPHPYEAKPYWQVFKEKFGFVPNLSVIDLLFNEGPESICYL